VVEFAVGSYQSFLKVDTIFRSGPRGKFRKKVPLWIKIWMMEEGLIYFQEVSMETYNPSARGRIMGGKFY